MVYRQRWAAEGAYMGRRTEARCLQGLLEAPCPVLTVLPVLMLPWSLMWPLAQRRLRPQAAFWWGLPVWPPAQKKLPSPQNHPETPNLGSVMHLHPPTRNPFHAIHSQPYPSSLDKLREMITPAAHLP